MGAGKAREFCLLCPTYSADEAYRNGLLSKVCDVDSLCGEVRKAGHAISGGIQRMHWAALKTI